MYLHNLNWLLLCLVERVRLVFDAVEVNVHQVDASDVAVPCSAIVELHGCLVCDSGELCRAWKTFWDVGHSVLAADWNIKVVQDMECLYYSLETCVPSWGCGLEE